ncbi:hypothetical protein J3T65_10690 [Staphylococcus simiae]|uniref:hypothetical protein n=1 Tax=Staphylococcus simiae TaxID=308354 RepID=UPI001A9797A7|nr:hypothetical protein [Staphylococcus simiae]MBO1199802.1 hypothetical protein [Staphylococcus simiae]MBO1202083.1 hypothetical protein [Staphylococcus simiae]MBO1204341.1 hypothetical protein [Staphylococcus simiae]MBO1211846.1 hypothetical protein [Staphylococcus simiae]MBO1230508.1 hypothetical protein [Staphylococcus simiae]
MLDQIISYFKNLPHSVRFTIKRLKTTWPLFIALIALCVLLLIAFELVVHFGHLSDIREARWMLRIVSFIVYLCIIFAIYKGYQHYAKDFMLMQSFNLSATIPNIVIVILAIVSLAVVTTFAAVLKPINFETSIIALLFYIVLSAILISTLSVTIGLLRLIFKNVDVIFYVCSIINIVILPIVFMPNPNQMLLNHILMLNPFYYLVNGMSQSVMFGVTSMENIPYHFYFVFIIVLLLVINFALARYTTHAIYKQHTKESTVTKPVE